MMILWRPGANATNCIWSTDLISDAMEVYDVNVEPVLGSSE